jgi:hypothetical protein
MTKENYIGETLEDSAKRYLPSPPEKTADIIIRREPFEKTSSKKNQTVFVPRIHRKKMR